MLQEKWIHGAPWVHASNCLFPLLHRSHVTKMVKALQTVFCSNCVCACVAVNVGFIQLLVIGFLSGAGNLFACGTAFTHFHKDVIGAG